MGIARDAKAALRRGVRIPLTKFRAVFDTRVFPPRVIEHPDRDVESTTRGISFAAPGAAAGAAIGAIIVPGAGALPGAGYGALVGAGIYALREEQVARSQGRGVRRPR